MPVICPHCGGNVIETDSGGLICTRCKTIVESRDA